MSAVVEQAPRPLEGKNAFVTGGNRDYGAGTVRGLARFGASFIGSKELAEMQRANVIIARRETVLRILGV